MACRIIIRFSINYDQGSVVRNNIAAVLNNFGIQNTNTGTWESQTITEQAAAQALAAVSNHLANATTLNPSAHMDHLWVYIDRA